MKTDFHHTILAKHSGLTVSDFFQAYYPFMADELHQNIFHHPIARQDALTKTQVTANSVLEQGQTLYWSIDNYQEKPVNTNWHCLWRSDQPSRDGHNNLTKNLPHAIMAVHKPAELPVSRTTRNIYNTLTELVRRESGWPEAQLLHRLDQDTSGIVLFAKNAPAAEYWQPQLHSLIQKKIYHAVVYGRPAWRQHACHAPLNTRHESPIRCQMHVMTKGEKGKASTTLFKTLSSQKHYSIIECELITGRKHQIRAHLKHLGHPIIGDKIYANNGEYFLKRLSDQLTSTDRERLLADHHLLFAQYISLIINQQVIEIENPHYPHAWQYFCEQHGLNIT